MGGLAPGQVITTKATGYYDPNKAANKGTSTEAMEGGNIGSRGLCLENDKHSLEKVAENIINGTGTPQDNFVCLAGAPENFGKAFAFDLNYNGQQIKVPGVIADTGGAFKGAQDFTKTDFRTAFAKTAYAITGPVQMTYLGHGEKDYGLKLRKTA